MARRRALPADLPEGEVRIDTGTIELEADPDRAEGVMVFVNGVESSYIDLGDPSHLEFEYMQQIRVALTDLLAHQERPRLLHLGGAACALPRALTVLSPKSQHVVVEIDRELSRVAREWFDLPRSPQLRIRTGEARQELATSREQTWDAVIRDAFVHASVPGHLTTREFTREVAAALKPTGRYLANLVDSPPLPMARREVATVREVFPEVALAVEAPILKGRRFGNLVIIASHLPLPSTLARQLLALPAPVRLVQGRELDQFVGTSSPLGDDELQDYSAPPVSVR